MGNIMLQAPKTAETSSKIGGKVVLPGRIREQRLVHLAHGSGFRQRAFHEICLNCFDCAGGNLLKRAMLYQGDLLADISNFK